MYRPNLNSVAPPVPEIIAIGVLGFGWGLRTPNLGEEEAVGGQGLYRLLPFESALVSSYRPSIVTFHLPLRVSEILSLMCASLQLATFSAHHL